MNKIILHHSLTKDTETVSWGIIRDYHINVNGWRDIGYHFGIEDLRGQTEIVMGRMPDQSGAHTKGYNAGSIGICFIGNFDLIPPPKVSWDKGIELCRFLVRLYKIRQILGHNELNPGKSCPGKLFDLSKFRREVYNQ